MSQRLFLVSIFAILLVGCGARHEGISDKPTPALGDEPGLVERLDFAGVSAAVFAPHCIQCHKSFAAYETVAARLGEIQLSVDTNQMPKRAPALPIELKQMLAKWIELGAPETAN